MRAVRWHPRTIPMAESFSPHEHALDELRWLRALAARLVRDPDLAEEAVQATLVRSLERPAGRGAPRAWLRAVLRNVLRQEWRGRSRRARREREAAHSGSAPATVDVVAELALHRHLLDEVRSLEEPYRRAIVLHYLRGRSPAEAAVELGLPVKTFHTHLERGLARLRRRLGREREAWALLLFPAPNPASASGLDPVVPPLVLGMKLEALAVAAGVLLVGVLVYWNRPSPRHDPVPAPAVAQGDRSAAAPAPPPTVAIPASRSAVPPQEAPAAPTPEARADAAGWIRGRVLALDGAGVPGLRIVFRAADGEAREVATSAADGGFALPPPDHAGNLEVEDPSWASVARPHLDGAPPLAPPLVVVAPARTYAGRVVDPEGNGIPGARVEVTREGSFLQSLEVGGDAVHVLLPFAETHTDATGLFQIPHVGVADPTLLWAVADGYQPAQQDASSGSATGIEIVLGTRIDGPRTLHGLVLDGAGSPVAGAAVSAGGRAATSGADGRFVLTCDDWRDRGWVRAVRAGCLPASVPLERVALPNSPDAPVILRLGGPTLAVRGEVRDAAGRPVPGAVVFTPDVTPFGSVIHEENGLPIEGECTVEALVNDRTGFWQATLRTVADERGRFELDGLLDRSYALFALDPGTLAGVGPVEAWPGGARLTLTVETPPLVPLAGRVVSRSGTPMAGVRVTPGRRFAWEPDPGSPLAGYHLGASAHQSLPEREALTDEAGRFSFPPLALEGCTLLARGADVHGAGNLVPAEQPDPGSLEIVVDAASHFRIVLDPPSSADFFRLETLDGKLRGLFVPVSGHVISAGGGELNAGVSGLADVPEGEYVVVLLRGDEEVRRARLRFPPGGPHELRP